MKARPYVQLPFLRRSATIRRYLSRPSHPSRPSALLPPFIFVGYQSHGTRPPNSLAFLGISIALGPR